MNSMATVLIVDDDDGVRRLADLILRQSGHETICACNGLEGLMVYSSYHRYFDLVLTDVDMPQMNGIELADRIRARDPLRKILLMSGNSRTEAGQHYPFLAKPFLPDQLVAAIDSILKQ